MKQKLLLLILCLFVTSVVIGQTPVQDQIDDFEDGTTQGWGHFGSAISQPDNITSDGPTGIDDNFIRLQNFGANLRPKHIMFNTEARWLGDFTSQGIVAIRMHVRNPGANDLHLRIGLRGVDGQSWIASTNAVVVVAGSGWSLIEIPILATDMTLTEDTLGGNSVAGILANNIQIRILSNDGSDPSGTPLHQGDTRPQTSEIDNIRSATSFLSTKDNKIINAFSISPNPGRDRLNLKVSKLGNNSAIEVFDVLGKKIYADRISTSTKSVDVSQWNNGIYLVRLTSDVGTQTKRFVKQ